MTRDVKIAIPGRITYVTGLVNDLEYSFSLADDGKWTAAVERSEDDIYRVQITAIDDRGSVGYYSTVFYYGLHLVTDRTQTDVLEKTEKGFYNATDLNRVGAAVSYLASELYNAGYWAKVDPKLDWQLSDLPTHTQLERYLEDVRAVHSCLPGVIELPDDMEGLDWQEANAIELALLEIDGLLQLLKQAYYYTGELYAGEV